MAWSPDILDFALLPALAAVCAATSYSDLKEGKIRNGWILAGAGWALAVYAALTLSRLGSKDLTDPLVLNTLFGGSWGALLRHTALNAFSALAVGFVLFHYNLWSAGDAKLFFALALLLPLKYYFRHYLPVFPSFNLFLNTIAVAAVFVWSETAFKLVRYAERSRGMNVWREIAGAAAAGLRGAVWLFLLAAVVFSLLLCASRLLHLQQRVLMTVTLLVMLALLFAGPRLNSALEDPVFKRRLGGFAAVLFAGLLLSPLRMDFLRMSATMSVTFFCLYFLVGILPSLGAKYGLTGDDMPFAAWLTAGLLITVYIKGSLLYLLLF